VVLDLYFLVQAVSTVVVQAESASLVRTRHLIELSQIAGKRNPVTLWAEEAATGEIAMEEMRKRSAQACCRTLVESARPVRAVFVEACMMRRDCLVLALGS